jgi:MHS family alpha-ketoglutarate permease-like MFS transporter
LQKAGQVELFFTYVTAAIAISLVVYIFALKNKKATHLDREQGDAWAASKTDDAGTLAGANR